MRRSEISGQRLGYACLTDCFFSIFFILHFSFCLYLRKASINPPSTAMTWPVVLLKRLLTQRKIASA